MWTGGPAPELPPSPSKKSTSQFFVPSRDVELEALRQRGLAKILNHHFSDQIQKLAAEKAAAEAALRDLEQHKKDRKKYKADGGCGEMSPLDSLYVSANKWKNECRRKEKETLLLYQRYVDKFGASGHVALPEVPDQEGETKQQQGQQQKRRSYSPSSMESESISSALFSPESARCSAPPPLTPPDAAALPPSRSDASRAIDQALEEYLQTNKEYIAAATVTPVAPEKKLEEAIPSAEAKFREKYRSQFGAVLADVKQTPMKRANSDDGNASSFICGGRYVSATKNTPRIGIRPNLSPVPFDEQVEADADGDGLGPLFVRHVVDDNDDDSCVSGLTFNSAVTREVMMEAEAHVVEFLMEEKEAIRRIMLDSDSQDSSSKHGRKWYQKRNQGSDVLSLSGHTHTTHQSMTSSRDNSNSSMLSALGTVQQQAADQAENMVEQMQNILNDFKTKSQPKSKSSRRGGKDKSVDGSAASTKVYPTSNPNEKWVVYYDETYQRDYYHEVNSNRTQWTPPEDDRKVGGDDPSATSSRMHGEDHTHITDLTNLSRRTGRSRLGKYRRQRRRRRRRRVVAIAVVTLACGLGSAYYLSNNYEAAGIVANLPIVKDLLPHLEQVVDLKMVQTWFVRIPKTSTTVLYLEKDDEAETKRKQEEAAKRERIQLEKEKRRLKRLLQDEAKNAEAARNEAASAALEQRGSGKLSSTRSGKKGDDTTRPLGRPWHCNMPFIYLVHGGCRKLASTNPVFDLDELVQSMMQ